VISPEPVAHPARDAQHECLRLDVHDDDDFPSRAMNAFGRSTSSTKPGENMLKTKLMSALVLAAVGAAAQAAIPDAISFDGYCDGITGISGSSGVFSATHDYTVCNENGGSYTNTPMSGAQGRKLMGGSGAGVATVDSSYTQFGATFSYVVNDDGTWFLLAPEYGGLVNLGTWTAGYGGNVVHGAVGTRASFQK
jgi:hypothetical protein